MRELNRIRRVTSLFTACGAAVCYLYLYTDGLIPLLAFGWYEMVWFFFALTIVIQCGFFRVRDLVRAIVYVGHVLFETTYLGVVVMMGLHLLDLIGVIAPIHVDSQMFEFVSGSGKSILEYAVVGILCGCIFRFFAGMFKQFLDK